MVGQRTRTTWSSAGPWSTCVWYRRALELDDTEWCKGLVAVRRPAKSSRRRRVRKRETEKDRVRITKGQTKTEDVKNVSLERFNQTVGSRSRRDTGRRIPYTPTGRYGEGHEPEPKFQTGLTHGVEQTYPPSRRKGWGDKGSGPRSE